MRFIMQRMILLSTCSHKIRITLLAGFVVLLHPFLTINSTVAYGVEIIDCVIQETLPIFARDHVPFLNDGEEEYCCKGGDLCWKPGPFRKSTSYGDIPYYFELTKDYEFTPGDYFVDPPPIKLPGNSLLLITSPPYTRENRRKEFVKLAASLSSDYDPSGDTSYKRKNIKWSYVDVVGNTIKIKKGYRWDGASRGIDNDYPTLVQDLRAALVHDVMYDSLRLDYLPHEPTKTIPFVVIWAYDYRDFADHLFFLLAVEDGHYRYIPYAHSAWVVLRLGGWLKADKNPEDDGEWRYHTMADATVTSKGINMAVNGDDKTLTITCPRDADEVELDASASSPIAMMPQTGIYIDGLHETTWDWSLNSGDLALGGQNNVEQDLSLDDLTTVITLGELRDAYNWVPGGPNYVTLTIDEGKDTLRGLFAMEDSVEIILEFDTVAPVVGCNASAEIIPPDAPISFTATATDNCNIVSSVEITQYECYLYTKKGKRINTADEEEGCVVELAGDTITILDSGGEGNHIAWTISSSDDSGNVSEKSCETLVVHPRK